MNFTVKGRRQDDDDGMTVRLPFASITGSSKILVPILIIVGLVALGYLLEKHDADSKERQQRTMEVIHFGNQEMAYILTLSQEQRDKLHLDMPQSLRERAHLERHEP